MPSLMRMPSLDMAIPKCHFVYSVQPSSKSPASIILASKCRWLVTPLHCLSTKSGNGRFPFEIAFKIIPGYRTFLCIGLCPLQHLQVAIHFCKCA
jgi:hypothetical protein